MSKRPTLVQDSLAVQRQSRLAGRSSDARGWAIEALIAALTLVAVFASFWRFGMTPRCATAVGFAIVLALLSVIDVRTRMLPDSVTFPLLGVGIVLGTLHGSSGLLNAIGGAAIGLGFLWGVDHLNVLRRGVHAIGIGDMKLAAAAGAWLGVAGIWQTLAIAVGCMGVWGAVAHLRSIGRDHVPFGPIIAAASIAALIFPLHPAA